MGDQKGPTGAGWDEEAGGGGGDGGWGNNYGEEWTQNQYAVTGTQAEPGYEKDMPPNIIKCTASRELLFRAREFPVELQEQFFQGAYVRLCAGAGYSGTGTDKEWVKKYLVCRIVRFEKAPDSEAPYSVKIQQGSQKFVKEGIRTRIVVSRGNLQVGYKLSSVSSEPILPREWRNLSLYSAMVDKKEAEAALASGEDLETITIKKHRPHSWSEMDLKDLEVIAARLEMAHHYSFGDEQINKMVGDRMGNASIRFRCLQSDADCLRQQIIHSGNCLGPSAVSSGKVAQLRAQLDDKKEEVAAAGVVVEANRIHFEQGDQGERTLMISEINNRNLKLQDRLDRAVAIRTRKEGGGGEQGELNPFARKPMLVRNMWDMQLRNKESQKRVTEKHGIKFETEQGGSGNKNANKANKKEKPNTSSPAPAGTGKKAAEGNKLFAGGAIGSAMGSNSNSVVAAQPPRHAPNTAKLLQLVRQARQNSKK